MTNQKLYWENEDEPPTEKRGFLWNTNIIKSSQINLNYGSGVGKIIKLFVSRQRKF